MEFKPFGSSGSLMELGIVLSREDCSRLAELSGGAGLSSSRLASYVIKKWMSTIDEEILDKINDSRDNIREAIGIEKGYA